MAALAATAAATLSLGVAGTGPAYGYEAQGYDVSWPQCGDPLPNDGDFRIVGVNGGRPYDPNPCLAQQYQWSRGAADAAFYINTANPGARSQVVNWYGQRSPNPACSRRDEQACAYDYGYNGAKHAWEYAQAETGAAARHSWWLDVETTNSWSRDRDLNVTVILGAVAFLRERGVPVGVYSTDYQWGVITGGAQMDLYNWHAGAGDGGQAARWCVPSTSFTGGPMVLVQWVEDDLDRNYACAPLPSSSATAAASGQSGLATLLADLLNLNLGKALDDLRAGG